MEADGDKVKVATPVFPPTPVTVVDNTAPTLVTFVDNTTPTPITVVDNTAPTPVTFVDNTTPTPVTVVDNTAPAPVIYVNNYDPAAYTASQPLPQKGAVKLSIKSDKTSGKPLQIAVGLSDIDSVDLLISFDFSSLKTDSTTVDSNPGAESNNPLIVPIGGGKINPGDAAADGGRISSGGGGQTH